MEDNLMDYITDNQEIERQPYRIKLKEINLLLTMNGFSEIGDLFDSSLFSVNKTLSVIRGICDDRKKLIEAKTDLLQKITKIETEYANVFKLSELSKEKVTELTNLNTFLKNKIYKDEKSYREDIEKLKNEKEELNKVVSKLSQKETKWKHEIKKKDLELSDVKNKLRKLMNDRDSIGNSIKNEVGFKINQTLTNINYATLSKEVLISFENLIKNSNSVLMNVNHLKEFYNLLFQAFNEKINYILNENTDLRECYKIILRELNKYMDFKKLLLQKLSKDCLYQNGKQTFKNDNNLINENLLQLDFNDGREQVLNNFNEILNTFRFILIYDQLHVDPNQEFNLDEATKTITNTKYDVKSLPYYKEIADLMENFDVNSLKTLKGTLDSLNIQTQDIGPKKEMITSPNTSSLLQQENKSVEILESINQDFNDTLAFLDGKILAMKDKIDQNKVEISITKVTNDKGRSIPRNTTSAQRGQNK